MKGYCVRTLKIAITIQNMTNSAVDRVPNFNIGFVIMVAKQTVFMVDANPLIMHANAANLKDPLGVFTLIVEFTFNETSYKSLFRLVRCKHILLMLSDHFLNDIKYIIPLIIFTSGMAITTIVSRVDIPNELNVLRKINQGFLESSCVIHTKTYTWHTQIIEMYKEYRKYSRHRRKANWSKATLTDVKGKPNDHLNISNIHLTLYKGEKSRWSIVLGMLSF